MTDSELHIQTNVEVIATALNKVRAAIEKIERTGSNPHFKYNYVEEGTLLAQVRKHLIEHGLVLTPEVTGQIKVLEHTGSNSNMTMIVYTQSYRLAHVSGAVWPWPISVVACGQDVNDKASWKASTGASKYVLMRLLQLATGDDPELDQGLDRGTPADPRTTQPRERAASTPQAGDIAALIGRFDPDAPATSEILKEIKFWPCAFRNSERIHGKDESTKFAAIDAYLVTINKRSVKQLKMGELIPAMTAMDNWDPMNQDAGEEHGYE